MSQLTSEQNPESLAEGLARLTRLRAEGLLTAAEVTTAKGTLLAQRMAVMRSPQPAQELLSFDWLAVAW